MALGSYQRGRTIDLLSLRNTPTTDFDDVGKAVTVTRTRYVVTITPIVLDADQFVIHPMKSMQGTPLDY